MDIDALFRAAAGRKNTFTSAELAEDLGVAPDEVAGALKTLSKLGCAEHAQNKWKLTSRRTEARDKMVLSQLGPDPISRTKLNESLPDFTPAQVYTSLQRLILKDQASKSRDGSRTPRYAASSA